MNNETGNNINARNNCVLELSGIVKNYKQGKQTLEVLAGIDLAIRPREVTALVGQSGSGKSTLLQIAGRTFRRRTTAGCDCTRVGQFSQTPAGRRADRQP